MVRWIFLFLCSWQISHAQLILPEEGLLGDAVEKANELLYEGRYSQVRSLCDSILRIDSIEYSESTAQLHIIKAYAELYSGNPAFADLHKDFASRIIDKQVPEFLQSDHIYMLDGDISTYLEEYNNAKQAYEISRNRIDEAIDKRLNSDAAIQDLLYRKAIILTKLGYTYSFISNDYSINFHHQSKALIDTLFSQKYFRNNDKILAYWKSLYHYNLGEHFYWKHEKQFKNYTAGEKGIQEFSDQAIENLNIARGEAKAYQLHRLLLLSSYKLGRIYTEVPEELDSDAGTYYYKKVLLLTGQNKEVYYSPEYGSALNHIRQEYIYKLSFANNRRKFKAINDSIISYDSRYLDWRRDFLSYQQKIQNTSLTDYIETFLTDTKLERENVLLSEKIDLLQKKTTALKTSNYWLMALAILILLTAVWIVYYRTMTNRQLQHKHNELKEEKAVSDKLKREMNHRVKNHLQIVASTMKTQLREGDIKRSKVASQAINEGINRVQAILLLHNQLYQKESSNDIDLQEYLQKLSEQLKKSFNYAQEKFVSEIQLNEMPPIDLEKATRLGMAVTELSINAFKYADHKDPMISIKANKLQNDQVSISVTDNGTGINGNYKKGFGLETTQFLIEKQFGGQFIIPLNSRKATKFEIIIPLKALLN